MIRKFYSAYLIQSEVNGRQIFNFLFVDEVQDLLPIQISFLSKLIDQNHSVISFAGDSAQAITAGNCFRFTRLKNIFYEEYGMKMCEIRLTKNYRSQAKIVALANEITSWIGKLFRDELDYLGEELGMKKGMGEPMALVKALTIEDLLRFTFGNGLGHQGDDNTGLMIDDQNSREMGADQCIIVANEKDRDTVLNSLKERKLKGNVLTLEESKGLEYDDVILYDIFGSSISGDGYRGLMQIYPERFNRSGIPKKLQYSLCHDLKLLYVGITRARKKLVFFESHRHDLMKVFLTVCGDSVISANDDYNSGFAKKSSSEAWRQLSACESVSKCSQCL